jgi:acetoacetyl-CoA synthetase
MLPGLRRRDPGAGPGAWRSRSSTTPAAGDRREGRTGLHQAFPKHAVGFWNDPDGSATTPPISTKFDNVWTHGDFAEGRRTGGIIIHGRSDATLNPGGVRIGTAEIYRQVEQMPEVLESARASVRLGRRRPRRAVRPPARGATLDDDLQKRANPREDPHRRVAAPRAGQDRRGADIPRTKSGKIVELAVRDVVHGRPVKNKEALANPEALEL